MMILFLLALYGAFRAGQKTERFKQVEKERNDATSSAKETRNMLKGEVSKPSDRKQLIDILEKGKA